ncbi:TRAP transporter small permease [Mesorhizobium marinum]|uniref:TRAP transporter small permease protein n=1 Tax=Mesorhizobium marinum TaxID=3228790 RepID=A0ABV3R1G7_9HYPH
MSFLRSVDRVIDAALVLAIAVIAASLVGQVALRYFAHAPLPWPEELSQFLLVAISFFGMYRAFENSDHISLKWLPRDWRLQRYLRAAGLLCVMVFLAYIGWGGWKLTQSAWHQPSTALRLPMAIPYLVIPVSCALSLLAVGSALWRVLSGTEQGAPESDGAAR